jgi:hypothetical protein
VSSAQRKALTAASRSTVCPQDGTVLEADTVLSGTTPYHTFLELLPGHEADR